MEKKTFKYKNQYEEKHNKVSKVSLIIIDAYNLSINIFYTLSACVTTSFIEKYNS